MKKIIKSPLNIPPMRGGDEAVRDLINPADGGVKLQILWI